MQIIYKSQLPKPESEVRADLVQWKNQVAAHAMTVGQPAPFPEYELLRFLEDDFIVPEEKETPDKEPLTLEQLKLERIVDLIQLLQNTDYVALSDYDKENPELIAQRQEWRDELRKLKNE